MKRSSSVSEILKVCVILLAFLPWSMGEAKGQLVSATQGWWDIDWRMRTPIMVVNQSNETGAGVPVFFNLIFPQGKVLSATNELRLIDQNNFELPTYVLHESRDGMFVRSASLLAFVAMEPGETRVIHAYYGNPSASPPDYRTGGGADSLRAGALSARFLESGSSLSSGGIAVSYGGVFSLTGKVKIASRFFPSVDYGPLEASEKMLQVVEGWTDIGNFTHLGYGGAKSVLRAGDISLIRALVTDGSITWVLDNLINDGGSPVDGLVFYDIYDAQSLVALGMPTARFDRMLNLLHISAAGLHFGVHSMKGVSGFDVSDPSSVYTMLREGVLARSEQASGSLAAALSYRLGDLKPGNGVQLLRVWSFGDDASKVASAVEGVASAIRVYPLPSETPETPIPFASGVYSAVVKMRNETIYPEATVKLVQGGFNWIPGPVEVDGRASYTVPSQRESSFEVPSIWAADRHSNGTSAYASASHWSGGERGKVGRVSVWGEAGPGSGNATLTSGFIKVYGAERLTLNFTYRAEVPPLGEHAQNQSLYVGLGFDYDFDRGVDRRLYFPVEGTQAPKNGTVVAELLAGGRWHSMEVDLSRYPDSEALQVKFDVVAASGEGPGGALWLDVDEVKVVVEAAARDILKASLASHRPEVTIRFPPDLRTDFVKGDLDVHFTVLAGDSMRLIEDGVYEASLSPPPLSLNQTGGDIVRGYRTVTDYTAALMLFSSHPPSALTVATASSPVSYYTYGLETLFIDGAPDVSSITLRAVFPISTLRVIVTDASKRPFPNALVKVGDGFGRRVAEASTDGAGSARLNLAPSLYRVTVLHHGLLVGNALILLASDPQEVMVSSRVYTVSFRVLDVLGRPIQGAEVRLARDGQPVAEEVTRVDGSAGFALVAQGHYAVEVWADGGEVLSSEFRAYVDDAVILLGTSYLPPAVQTAVAMALVAAVVTALVAVGRKYFKGRLPP